MSAPRCLRTAIEACRPCKNTAALRLQSRITQNPSYRTRGFSSSTPRCVPQEDITAGFPMPELGSRKMQDWEDKNEEEKPVQRPTPTKSSKEPKATPNPQKKIPSRAETAPSNTQAQAQAQARAQAQVKVKPPAVPEQLDENTPPPPPLVPRNVLAAYRTPMRHPLTHGVPVASLQLRSYSVRNLEFYADFCVRAAYYLGLPCTGPTPLPRKRERWTVLRSNFAKKKSQENFERITMKRLISVYDGEPSVVEVWLAFLRKWQFYGVGMKANVWQWEEVDVAGKMDREFKSLEAELDDKLRLFGFNKAAAGKTDLLRLMDKQNHRQVGVGASEVREKSRTTGDPF